MPVVSAVDTQEHRLHGVTFTSYACSASGSRRLAAWRADFQPRTSGQAHRMSAEEVLHVLDGRLEVRLDAEVHDLGPGDVVLVPAGTTFCVSNVSDHPARLWAVTTVGMTATMVHGGETLAPPWAQ